MRLIEVSLHLLQCNPGYNVTNPHRIEKQVSGLAYYVWFQRALIARVFYSYQHLFTLHPCNIKHSILMGIPFYNNKGNKTKAVKTRIQETYFGIIVVRLCRMQYL